MNVVSVPSGINRPPGKIDIPSAWLGADMRMSACGHQLKCPLCADKRSSSPYSCNHPGLKRHPSVARGASFLSWPVRPSIRPDACAQDGSQANFTSVTEGLANVV